MKLLISIFLIISIFACVPADQAGKFKSGEIKITWQDGTKVEYYGAYLDYSNRIENVYLRYDVFTHVKNDTIDTVLVQRQEVPKNTIFFKSQMRLIQEIRDGRKMP